MLELRIEELLKKKFAEPEFQNCFLVDVTFSNDKDLKVYMDSDDKLTLDTCRKISRYLEEYLDDSTQIAEKYRLEVSSPGLDRPLKFHRQYKKNIGRKLEFYLQSGEKITGILKDVKPDSVTLETPKKSKKKPAETHVIEIKDINKSLVIPSF